MTATGERCIAVTVAGALYGLPVEQVQEVIGVRPLTRVFHAPAAVAGVTSLRGDVLPVLELGVLLGEGPRIDGAAEARIVVVREVGGQRRQAGLAVGALRGLRDYPEAGLMPPPTTLQEPARRLVIGIVPSAPPCAVLSIAAIFSAPELMALAVREATA